MNPDSRGVDREQHQLLLQSVRATFSTIHFAPLQASSNALGKMEWEDTKGYTARHKVLKGQEMTIAWRRNWPRGL